MIPACKASPLASHIGECRCGPIAHIDKGKKEALKKRVAELKTQAELEAKPASASRTLEETDAPQEKGSEGWRKRSKYWLGR